MNNDGWEFKDIKSRCELCGGDGCKRMTYKDEFVELLDNLHDSDMMANNKRRHSMYCNYVCIKYGVLGVGVRKQI